MEMPELDERPVVCFTSDLDWAPEWAIAETLRLFDASAVPLTPFVTHDSRVLRERYQGIDMKPRVGVHPNFLPGSSHGETVAQVIETVRRLWPEAVSFRSHSFFDTTPLARAFREQGFLYDSNLCLFLQPRCVPLQHNSGLLRFPVFWEDDIHFDKQLPFDLETVRSALDTPGLKIFNVHPFHVALNTPTSAYYQAHRYLYRLEDPACDKSSVYAGQGVRTLLEEVLEYCRAQGYRTAYLHDLFLELAERPLVGGDDRESWKGGRSQAGGGDGRDAVAVYQQATRQERAEIVRDVYEARDAKSPYATSRDFHLRELEISFIGRHVAPGAVLDIGCGNGYTLLSLAKKMKADFIGVDFSPNMLKGAQHLLEQHAGELQCLPQFQMGDVRQLSFADHVFDCVISERCVLNLPSKEDQRHAIREVHRVLKDRGILLLVEGTEDGLLRLNEVRRRVGLGPIPSVAHDNVSSLKFHESEMSEFLQELFDIEATQYFGTYYLISRVVHPLLVHPEEPRFEAKINAIARQVAEIIPDIGRLGHMMGYKLRAKKAQP